MVGDWAHIGLWVGSQEDRVQGVCCSCPAYVREILDHAGLFYTEPERASLAAPEQAVLLFVGNVALTPEEAAGVRAHLERAGAAVFVAHHGNVPELLGVQPAAPAAFAWGAGFVPLGEGYLQPAPGHPVTEGIPRPLHYFGGTAVEAAGARVLATGADALGLPDGRPLVTEHRVGRGLALLIAADLPGTVASIQQGTYVDTDRPSAPDGSANTADNVLKCDDGCVLHFALDRDRPLADAMPCFATPVADRWRELLIRALLHAARSLNLPLPLLWYYPRHLPALGMLSFDSDGNDPELARALLANLGRLGVRGTWAIMEPGYEPGLLQELLAAGMEVGLHFNALDSPDVPTWSPAAFARQHQLLSERLGQPVTSNKNHYTRWQGRLEFFRWCAEIGIQVDESRGPSKTGEIGFPFGTCHPYFPMERDGERLPVMEIGFLTQDLVVTAPAAMGRLFVDWVRQVHGVAHLLFHPAHCTKSGVYEAMADFVGYAREQGLELWTDAQILAWEPARRGVTLTSRPDGFTLQSPAPLPQATVLVLDPQGEAEHYGCRFRVHQADLTAGEAVAFGGG